MRPSRLASVYMALGTLAFLVLAAPPTAVALDPDRLLSQYGIRSWNTAGGLPSGAINAIVQDGQQYLWLGTNAGPVRFNGATFTAFPVRSPEGVSLGTVTSLARSRDGALWMGTASGGVAVRQQDRFEPLDSGLTGGTITSIAPDPSGGVIVAGLSGIRHLPHGSAAELEHVNKDYQAVLYDHDGALWIGTRDGRGLLRALVHDAALEITAQYQAAAGLAGNTITALHQDSAGDIWIGTTGGLSRLHEGRLSSLTAKDGLAHNHVTSIVSDRDGNLWVGTRGGLTRIRDQRIDSLHQREGLSHNDVRSLCIDHEGNLWVGTASGLTRINDTLFVTYGSPEGISDPRVRAVTTGRDDAIWVSTDAGGIFKIQRGAVTPLAISPPLPAESILVLHEAPDGALWVGLDDGQLFRIKDGVRSDETPREPSGIGKASVAISKDDSIIWAIQDGGVGRLQNHRFETLFPEFTAKRYYMSLYVDASDTYWFGTQVGLYRMRDHTMSYFTTEQGLPSNRVRWIHGEADGTVWLATQSGLACRRNDRFLRTLTQNEGLPEDFLRSILDDGRGNFWFSSMEHIFLIPKKSLVAFAEGKALKVAPVLFDQSDGLRSLECPLGHTSAVRSPDGKLWFVTADGVSAVDPARYPLTLPPPKVYIEDLSVDGSNVRQASYPPGSGNVEIRFAALSYRAPEKTTFRYKLEGVDESWVEASSEHSARYRRVGPGSYTFRVSARSRNGTFTEQEASVAFVLDRHWYQTRWWYGLLAAGVIALGVLLDRWRLYYVRARERELARRVEAALAEVKVLSGMLPICAWCHEIRDDKGYWSGIETYIQEHSSATLSHGICPKCLAAKFAELEDGPA